MAVYSLNNWAYHQQTLKQENGWKIGLRTLLWWAMWLRKQKKYRESNLVTLFLLYLYTSDRSRTEYSPVVLQTWSNLVSYSHLVITHQRVLQLHSLVIEPLNYTYHTSWVVVASPRWQNDMMIYPLVTKKVITHFPMKNNDPVTIEQRYHLRKQKNPFPSISQASQWPSTL